jgi:hypothetical protein
MKHQELKMLFSEGFLPVPPENGYYECVDLKKVLLLVGKKIL